MTYDEAKQYADAGKAVVLTNTGGWRRYGHFSHSTGGTILVRLFSTNIARFHPDGRITLNMGGHRTATTKEALNVLVSDYGVLWTERKRGLVFHAHGGASTPYVDGMEVPA